MGTIDITTVPVTAIEAVRPLWEKLRFHHLHRSPHFGPYYESLTFEKRIEKFLGDDIDINIDVARDGGTIVGYCISTIDRNGYGEVDSIFIEEEYRLSGTGDRLLGRAIEWLKAGETTEITIVVAAGNEEALPFYRRYGFYPAHTTLKPGRE
ncbi:MAG TPA: GNAT family N-acetyltransferase [Spirochaetota bacterium]|nr:GNAT family N-acetyltransferase [Spirochaetota bacterium]